MNNLPPGNHDDYTIGDAEDKNSFTFTANFDCKPESNAYTTCQTPHGIVYGLYVKDHYFMIGDGETYSGSKVIDFSSPSHPITVALRTQGVLVKYFFASGNLHKYFWIILEKWAKRYEIGNKRS